MPRLADASAHSDGTSSGDCHGHTTIMSMRGGDVVQGHQLTRSGVRGLWSSMLVCSGNQHCDIMLSPEVIRLKATVNPLYFDVCVPIPFTSPLSLPAFLHAHVHGVSQMVPCDVSVATRGTPWHMHTTAVHTYDACCGTACAPR